PVVVTDVGSLGEIVREFRAGEVVPVGDSKALAEACARLLEPKALAAARRGAERAAQQLTWERSSADHDRLYREVRRGDAACGVSFRAHGLCTGVSLERTV